MAYVTYSTYILTLRMVYTNNYVDLSVELNNIFYNFTYVYVYPKLSSLSDKIIV